MGVGARNTAVVGLQWGDEGKGKVIDQLSGDIDVVVRCQGGANAGHTVVVGGRKTVLHLLPSGVLHERAHCVIGNGVVLDPKALCDEIDDLAKGGQDVTGRLLVSDRAHVVLPTHRRLDAAHEAAKGKGKVGTTLRGIGPTYGDKIARTSLRAGELTSPDLPQRLRARFNAHNQTIMAMGGQPLDVTRTLHEFLPYCRRVAPLVCDTADWLHRADAAGKTMMFEGAQGILLDVDFGTYPFVTSSNTGVGGIITGSGLSHKALHDVVGVVKAYTTRVGSGPFPVEILGPKGEALRQRGGEFGATTGRPRRCGWLDLVAVRFAIRLNGIDAIALTKLDILDGEPELPVCVAYDIDGTRVETVPASIEDLARATPVYQTMPGWTSSIANCQRWDDLPQAAKDYVAFIERFLGVPVRIIGTGPGREATIVR